MFSSYDVMRKCWDEKFEKRPEFSFLVHTMGNMLPDSYKKVSYFAFIMHPVGERKSTGYRYVPLSSPGTEIQSGEREFLKE